MSASLNWVDYVFIVIFLYSMLSGFFRGFVKEIVSLATLIIAFIVATLFANPLATAFTNSDSVQSAVGQASNAMGSSAAGPASYIAIGLSFFVLFIATIIIGAIISAILNLAFQAGILGFGNRILGAVFGLVRAFLVNMVIVFLVQLTSFSTSQAWQNSTIVAMYQPSVSWLSSTVSPTLANLKDKFGQTMQGVENSLQGQTNTQLC